MWQIVLPYIIHTPLPSTNTGSRSSDPRIMVQIFALFADQSAVLSPRPARVHIEDHRHCQHSTTHNVLRRNTHTHQVHAIDQ